MGRRGGAPPSWRPSLCLTNLLRVGMRRRRPRGRRLSHCGPGFEPAGPHGRTCLLASDLQSGRGRRLKCVGRSEERRSFPRGHGCCRKASWVPGRQTGADRQKGRPVVAGDLLAEARSSVSGLPWLQGWGGGCPYQAPKPHSLLGAGLPCGSGSLRLPGHRALCRAHTQRAAPRGHGCAHPCPFRSLASVRPGTAGLSRTESACSSAGLGRLFLRWCGRAGRRRPCWEPESWPDLWDLVRWLVSRVITE